MIRSHWGYNGFYFFDDATQERIPVRAIRFEDDFLDAGAAAAFPTTKTAGSHWIKKTVQTAGSPSVAVAANAAGGVVKLALDNTSEKQEATLYFGDQLTFDVTKKAVFAARVQFPVTPTGNAFAAIGLAAAWADGPDAIAEYLHFAASGNATLLAETQDGTTQNSVSTGFAFTGTSDWHDLVIDASDPTSVKFLVDGAQQLETTVLGFAATGASAILQPYLSIYKASGTGVGTLAVDYVRVSADRV